MGLELGPTVENSRLLARLRQFDELLAPATGDDAPAALRQSLAELGAARGQLASLDAELFEAKIRANELVTDNSSLAAECAQLRRLEAEAHRRASEAQATPLLHRRASEAQAIASPAAPPLSSPARLADDGTRVAELEAELDKTKLAVSL